MDAYHDPTPAGTPGPDAHADLPAHAVADIEENPRCPAEDGIAAASMRRQRRAAVARWLLSGGSECAEALDWATLDSAPDWMAMPAPDFARLSARLGAIARIAEVRLWIDRARLNAAAAAVGADWLHSLRVERTVWPLPEPGDAEPIETAADVPVRLARAGAAILAASVPEGVLRQACLRALGSGFAAPLNPTLAATLVARAWP